MDGAYLCLMTYLWLKSLHIIFIVTWFAGLFYAVRLFIYQREAQDKPANERDVLTPQFKLMSRRLWYGITWPSAILAGVFGSSLLVVNPILLQMPWLQVKLVFITGLYIYHFGCHSIFQRQQKDEYTVSSNALRMWNEVATLFLFTVVFLVIFKTATSFLWGVLGMVVLAVLLFGGFYVYKGIRDRSGSK